MVEFAKETEYAVFFDPTNHFKENRIPIEKRIDPLTGQISRVLQFRFQLPEARDLEPTINQSLNFPCPFCPDTVAHGTPKFLPNVAREGRLTRGEAVVVPNLFPYEKYSAVTRITEGHFVPLPDFSVQALTDGLMVSLEYLERICRQDSAVKCGSINWNYMPEAGGGLVHPHFQPVAFSSPSQFMTRIAQCSAEYLSSQGNFFWEEYVKEEERRGKRFMGRVGKVCFLSPFAPTNMTGEVMAVFGGQETVHDDPELYFRSFCEGLSRVLKGLWDLKFTSLNMALYLYFEPQEGVWTFGRITPRVVIPPLNTGDVNYYEKLHEERFCVFSPEDMASHLRDYF